VPPLCDADVLDEDEGDVDDSVEEKGEGEVGASVRVEWELGLAAADDDGGCSSCDASRSERSRRARWSSR
jgi:hypothetical protein